MYIYCFKYIYKQEHLKQNFVRSYVLKYFRRLLKYSYSFENHNLHLKEHIHCILITIYFSDTSL